MRLFSIAGICGAALALLAGCQTTDHVGTASITSLPKRVVDEYHSYRQSIEELPRNDFAFVYDEKKRAGTWAAESKYDGVSYAIQKALKICAESTYDLSCKVFDINGRIVWKGIHPELHARLNNVPRKRTPQVSKEYSEAELTLSSQQRLLFEEYANAPKKYDHSAFYISKDGKSAGSLFVNGLQGYSLSKEGALKNCTAKSNGSQCYHFAQDGKPVNEAARIAIYGKN